MLQSAIETLVRGEFTSRQFILHWAQETPRDAQWMGRLVTFPPYNVVGRDAARYDDGEPIPGTLVISDFIGEDADGNTRLAFDALKAVHYWLGIQPRRNANGTTTNSPPSGVLFKAGLSALPDPPTREDVKITLSVAKERILDFEYDRALDTIQAFDARNEKLRLNNKQPIAGGAAYNEAVLIVQRHTNKQAAALGVEPEDLKGKVIDDEDVDFKIYMKSKLFDRVEQLLDASVEKKAAVLKDLLDDPQIRRQLWSSYSIRKKGHMEVPLEQLDEARAEAITKGMEEEA